MSLETKTPPPSREDGNVENILDRLDAARHQRGQILDVLDPANDDRRAVNTHRRPFPKLKPPRRDSLDPGAARNWDWVAPWALSFAIFVLIFVFAVR